MRAMAAARQGDQPRALLQLSMDLEKKYREKPSFFFPLLLFLRLPVCALLVEPSVRVVMWSAVVVVGGWWGFEFQVLQWFRQSNGDAQVGQKHQASRSGSPGHVQAPGERKAKAESAGGQPGYGQPGRPCCEADASGEEVRGSQRYEGPSPWTGCGTPTCYMWRFGYRDYQGVLKGEQKRSRVWRFLVFVCFSCILSWRIYIILYLFFCYP